MFSFSPPFIILPSPPLPLPSQSSQVFIFETHDKLVFPFEDAILLLFILFGKHDGSWLPLWASWRGRWWSLLLWLILVLAMPLWGWYRFRGNRLPNLDWSPDVSFPPNQEEAKGPGRRHKGAEGKEEGHLLLVILSNLEQHQAQRGGGHLSQATPEGHPNQRRFPPLPDRAEDGPRNVKCQQFPRHRPQEPGDGKEVRGGAEAGEVGVELGDAPGGVCFLDDLSLPGSGVGVEGDKGNPEEPGREGGEPPGPAGVVKGEEGNELEEDDGDHDAADEKHPGLLAVALVPGAAVGGGVEVGEVDGDPEEEEGGGGGVEEAGGEDEEGGLEEEIRRTLPPAFNGEQGEADNPQQHLRDRHHSH